MEDKDLEERREEVKDQIRRREGNNDKEPIVVNEVDFGVYFGIRKQGICILPFFDIDWETCNCSKSHVRIEIGWLNFKFGVQID